MEELIKKLKIEVQVLKGQLVELGVAPRAPDKNTKLAVEAAPEKKPAAAKPSTAASEESKSTEASTTKSMPVAEVS